MGANVGGTFMVFTGYYISNNKNTAIISPNYGATNEQINDN